MRIVIVVVSEMVISNISISVFVVFFKNMMKSEFALMIVSMDTCIRVRFRSVTSTFLITIIIIIIIIIISVGMVGLGFDFVKSLKRTIASLGIQLFREITFAGDGWIVGCWDGGGFGIES